ncbi:hypothetical protein A7K91_03355 [Paenibacillus oryzae]|uniref:HTH cro/C1-type domain-containing protein n=1 Tax=Paenibacillus oryzae TaxID=1844972 RepID=A0A1A5YM93_9BACL|nr:helix-turn-helix transcriptional regulator [Paenibacillus oryzae]OBR66495.1 hypothetical protein A7K91_03355 [Paenibacillus oryzae]
MNLGKNIGENIRLLRLQKGMSQEQLALHSSINISYLGQIERGEKNNCTINTLEKIATGLDCSFNTLFSGETHLNNRVNEKNPVLTVLNSDDLKQIIIDAIRNNVSGAHLSCKGQTNNEENDS